MVIEELKQKLKNISDENLIIECRKQVSDLAKTYGKSHRMSIPPNEKDTDFILTELLDRFEMLLILEKFSE